MTTLDSLVQNSRTAGTVTDPNSGLSGSRTRIADNFDQFLGLLTTQLKNQSPLDPLDTNQFTQQLVQFAGVEQQLRTNETLNSLVSANKLGAATSALAFVGMKATFNQPAAPMQDGKVKWVLNAPKGGQADVTIRDANGTAVHTSRVTLRAGEQEFVWDGLMPDGRTQAANGTYTISLTAKDASQQTMDVKAQMLAAIDSVDVSGAEPMVTIAGETMKLADIKSFRRS
jgi:flagellar basal-body rod modification protein FlgD